MQTIERFVRDLFGGVKALRRDRGVTVVLVLTLAVGIGANSAMFSVLRGVVLEPLPYPEPDRLVIISSSFPTMGFDRFWIDPPEFMSLREWSTSYSALGAYRAGESSLVTPDRPLRVRSAVVSASLLEAFGVRAQVGRIFTEEEDTAGGPPVALVSHELWQRAFGGRDSLVGDTVTVNGEVCTVVGVMPPGFYLEEGGIEIWRPLAFGPSDRERNGNHFLWVAGRLREDVTLEEARSELQTLVAGWEDRAGERHGPSPDGHPLHIAAMHEEVVGGARPALFALLGAVGFLLLIACANVAGLLIARADTRRREMAVRAGLGASRRTLLRQLLTENLALALLGALLGLVFAHLGLELLVREFPDSLPRVDEIGLDGQVIAFTAAISIVSVVLFGLLPAVSLSRTGVASLLRQGAQRNTSDRAWSRVRGGLVVLEVGLALALVVGSGLMVRTLWELLQVDRGFDSERLWTFELRLPQSDYPETAEQRTFYDRLLGQLRSRPEVEEVAAISGLPPQRVLNANDMEFEGVERTDEGPAHNVDYWQFVTSDALEVLDQRVIAGRGFHAADEGAETPVVLINRRLADVFYPNQDAVGRRLRPGFGEMPWMQIVGVLEDVPQRGLEQRAGTEVYFNYGQSAALFGMVPRTMNVMLRSRAEGPALAELVRTTVWGMDPQLPISGVRSFDEVVAGTLARPRLLTRLLVVFGLLALFLAAIGLYALLGKMVADRRRELGIRMAMGAQRRSILGIVVGRAAVLAAAGLVLGVALASLVTRVLSTQIFGVEPVDPWVYGSVSALLLAVTGIGCFVPALRAVRLEPARTLREE